jgi:DNA-binding NtrC family response regulator
MAVSRNLDIMIDSFLDGITGAALFGKLRRPSAPTVLFDSRSLGEALPEYLEMLSKSTRRNGMRDSLHLLTRAYERSLLKQQLQTVHQSQEEPGSCDRLIGSSPQMQRVYHLIRRATNLNASVLVTGESGTGKELIARAIHNLGSRWNRPFVAVSCGAIPKTLIEAELFGYEKGAFRGAVGVREGYFEQAGDGTLFLDEIGDLSLFMQVHLLKVLQQMEFSRIGGNKLIPLRARFVFATHRDLAELVAEGKFRRDLFYRINVLRIDSPPLREHPEDIPRIAMHFLLQYTQVFQKPMEGIEPDALELLQRYPWPGNVRELENVMQRAIILATGQTVRAEDLSLNMLEEDGVDCMSEDELLDHTLRQVVMKFSGTYGHREATSII